MKPALAGAALALLAGCSIVPLDVEKPASFAPSPPGPSLLLDGARSIDAGPEAETSFFAALADGNEALGARLRLIERAERTLDLQYFLMKTDLGGALIAEALLDAADRGVRVRLLLDDVFTSVRDEGLGLLSAHEAIEVRIFNPAPRPGPKVAGFLSDFGRMNRRMHNKVFIADGAFAIIGGRNIADEYYQLATASEFADFEVLALGEVVPALERSFDAYWNDGWAAPMEKLQAPPDAETRAEAREALTAALVPARDVYARAVDDPYFVRLRDGEQPLFRGEAEVVVDPPEKLKVAVKDGERRVADALVARMQAAEDSVTLLTPYFVPLDEGAEMFAALARRGVRVRIVTNSLASGNHAYVHAGYRRHRKSLLEAGAGLYEIRADALQATGAAPEGFEGGVVMHTKLAVIDGRATFVGSLNFDPRSIELNSELGVFIDSEEIGEAVETGLEEDLGSFAWRLTLAEDGALEWRWDGPGGPAVERDEPGAGLAARFVANLAGLLIPLGVEGQL